MVRRLLPTLLFASLALHAGGCLVDQSGVLSAERMGDVTSPGAVRVAPDEELRSACGAIGQTGANAVGVVRHPYLQQVTTSSALITWTTTVDAPARVEVLLPSGARVGSFPAVAEAAEPHSGARPLSARVEGLEPDTTYCYEVHDEGELPVVDRVGFRTAPAGGMGKKVRFLAFGDAGTGSDDQRALARQMATVPIELMLPLGDNAYEQGSYTQYEENFFPIYASLFRSFPVVPVSGNHEYETDDGAPFRGMFALPDNTGEGGRDRWFSFDRGDVHFVGLDTERVGEEQAAWLERDLAQTRQPWKIVYCHRPPFSSGEHGSNDAVRATFSPIFARHGVQLVLSSHDHDYERTKPQDGVTYVVSGGGGKGVRAVGASDFTAFSIPVIHFVYVEVEGDRLALHAIDGSGTEFDSVALARDRRDGRPQ